MLLYVRNIVVSLRGAVKEALSRSQHILHLPFAVTSLKNIFTCNKYKLKSSEALARF